MANWIMVLFTAVIASATVLYAWLTSKLWKETKKSADAAARAADAAAKAADAAHQSVKLARQQFEEQAGLGRTIVETAVTRAKDAIKYWRLQIDDLTDLVGMKALPPTDNLVPSNARTVIEHAARLDPEAAQEIDSAFTDMQTARNEIEGAREVQISAGRRIGHYSSVREAAADFLDSALDKLSYVELALFPEENKPVKSRTRR